MPEPRFTDIDMLKKGYLDKRADYDDDWLNLLLDSSERMFERGTNRLFGPDPAVTDPVSPPVVRRISSGGGDDYEGTGPVQIFLPDARELVSLSIGGSAVAVASEPDVWPLDGYSLVTTRPGEPSTSVLVPGSYVSRLTQSYDIIALGYWGFAEVPGDVHDAVYLMAARAAADRAATYADQVMTPEGDNLAYFRSMPQRAWSIFRSYWTPGP